MSKSIRSTLLTAAFLLACSLSLTSGLLFAQSSSQPQAPASLSSAPPTDAGKASASGENQGEHARRYASPGDKPVENADEEENSQFKYRAMWKIFDERALAAKTGLPKEFFYWLYVIINFSVLVFGLSWAVKKVILPNGFAPRTAEIQKGIEEARKASAEAGARLSEIEGRLSKLDAEIAGIRTAAEADFSVEEQRIKSEAEQDARHVVAAAEQEISAAARSAQRDLKAFAAGLAVDLAEKKIHVDDATDQALVRQFAAQLGKDGQ